MKIHLITITFDEPDYNAVVAAGVDKDAAFKQAKKLLGKELSVSEYPDLVELVSDFKKASSIPQLKKFANKYYEGITVTTYKRTI